MFISGRERREALIVAFGIITVIHIFTPNEPVVASPGVLLPLARSTVPAHWLEGLERSRERGRTLPFMMLAKAKRFLILCVDTKPMESNLSFSYMPVQ